MSEPEDDLEYDVDELHDRLYRRGVEVGKLTRENDELRAQNARLCDTFIHESLHPECVPSHRFRVVMPAGHSEWFLTREEAREALSKAVAGRTQ